DFAGESPFLLRVEILSAERDFSATHRIGHSGQVRKRRADRNGDAALIAQSLNHRGGQLSGAGGGRVHLPVAGDEFLPHGAHSTGEFASRQEWRPSIISVPAQQLVAPRLGKRRAPAPAPPPIHTPPPSGRGTDSGPAAATRPARVGASRFVPG